MELVCVRYDGDLHKDQWDKFVDSGKNASFLLKREFMEYHSDRFLDHSVIVFNQKNNQVVGCLPSCESDNKIYSHKGLTYGGLVLDASLKYSVIESIFSEIIAYYKGLGFKEIVIKPIPRFYNDIQSDELENLLWESGATLFRKDLAFVVNMNNRIKVAGNIRREAVKASKVGVTVSSSGDFEIFWNNILVPNLSGKYDASPVHTLEEILKLKQAFPDNIELVTSIQDGEIIAGTVLFRNKRTLHCQYIASTIEARNNGGLNLLFTEIMNREEGEIDYFDFGTALTGEGELNRSLMAWKERMGGRGHSHDWYNLSL